MSLENFASCQTIIIVIVALFLVLLVIDGSFTLFVRTNILGSLSLFCAAVFRFFYFSSIINPDSY